MPIFSTGAGRQVPGAAMGSVRGDAGGEGCSRPSAKKGALSGGIAQFMADPFSSQWAFPGGRRAITQKAAQPQREPQIMDARTFGYYRQAAAPGEYRRHLQYAKAPVCPEWKYSVRTRPKTEHQPRRADSGRRHFSAEDLSRYPIAHPHPHLPKLIRPAHGPSALRTTKEERPFSKSLGRKSRVEPGQFTGTGRAGDTAFERYGSGPRVEDQPSANGETAFFKRPIDTPTYRRFVANLAPSPRVPFFEKRQEQQAQALQQQKDHYASLVRDLEEWSDKLEGAGGNPED